MLPGLCPTARGTRAAAASLRGPEATAAPSVTSGQTPRKIPLPAEVRVRFRFRFDGCEETLLAAAALPCPGPSRPQPHRHHVGPQRPHEAAADPVHGGRRARPQREG